MFVHSKRVYLENEVRDCVLKIENKKIVEILNTSDKIDIEAGNNRIIPGIIDTHNHGTLGYSVIGDNKSSFDQNMKDLKGYLKGLASQGVTACLPTCSEKYYEACIKLCQEEVDGAKICGIHSEGPYLNRVGEKGVDKGHLDVDLEHVKAMYDKAEGMLKLFDIAPELPNSTEVIKFLTKKGVRVGFAHSNCNYEETLKAFANGITVVTHTANVMSGIHHRHMGGLGACLMNDDVYNELICDGLHVSNIMIEMMFRIKKDYLNKFMMISDCTPASGAPIGKYSFDGLDTVNIDKFGYCLTDTGRLMGSTMPVLKGIKNLANNVKLPLLDILKMSSRNPATVYGINNKGILKVNYDADFIIIDDEYNCLKTFCEGKMVYNRKTDKNIFNQEFINKYQIK